MDRLLTKTGFLLLVICIAGGISIVPTHAAYFDQSHVVGDSVGVDVDNNRRTHDQFEKIKEAGFGYVRISMTWADIEKSYGRYDWDQFDDIISTLRDTGLKAIIIVWWGNPLYSGTTNVPADIFGQTRLALSPASAQDVQAFAAFAAAAAQRYPGDDIVWEIWNEPNDNHFWVPKPDAAAYANLASVTCQAIRKAVPGARIIGPALSKLPSTEGAPFHGFAETMYQFPVVSCLDALSVHPYRHKDQIPETVIDEYAASKKFVADHTPKGQKPLPLIDSEWGYSISYVTPEEQAAYDLRSLFSSFISGIPLAMIYQWKDSYEASLEDREAHFGLIQFDGDPNPSFTALHDILPRIHDAVYERRLPTSDPATYVISFRQPDGSRTLAYWTSRPFSDPPHELAIKFGASATTYAVTPMPQLIDIGTAAPVLAMKQSH